MKRVYGNNSINNYELLEDVSFKLSNGFQVTIPKGYKWDLSSVPRFLWWLLPPDGDFQIGALIHDFLYENKDSLKHDMAYMKFDFTREFCDQEMYKWSSVLSGTKNKSIRNIDNKLRLWGVCFFGWYVYNK
jgi:hypothetical protein